jgi:hypothetical protein
MIKIGVILIHGPWMKIHSFGGVDHPPRRYRLPAIHGRGAGDDFGRNDVGMVSRRNVDDNENLQ